MLGINLNIHNNLITIRRMFGTPYLRIKKLFITEYLKHPLLIFFSSQPQEIVRDYFFN